jgi:hypothetical protein
MVSLLCLMEQSRFDTDAADRAHLLARSLARRPGILPTGASPLGEVSGRSQTTLARRCRYV